MYTTVLLQNQRGYYYSLTWQALMLPPRVSGTDGNFLSYFENKLCDCIYRNSSFAQEIVNLSKLDGTKGKTWNKISRTVAVYFFNLKALSL